MGHSLSPREDPGELCDPEKLPDVFAKDEKSVGQCGGTGFCLAPWKKGSFINSIDAESDGNGIRWLRLGFTDGTFVEKGNHSAEPDKKAGSLKWDPWKQWFDEFVLHDGGWNNNVGKMFLKVGDASLDLGQSKNPEVKPTRGPKGAGMLMGFAGSSGWNIDCIRPIFSVGRPSAAVINNITFTPSFTDLNKTEKLP